MTQGIDNKKVFVAAVAGVYSYLKAEEEAHAQTATETVRSQPDFSVWSSFGRQEMMNMRLMWQRRLFR